MVWCIYLSYQFPLTIKIDFWLANICQRLSFLRSFWHLSITMKHWRQKRRAFLKMTFFFVKMNVLLMESSNQFRNYIFFSSGQTASAKSKLRKLWRNFCAKTLTDKMKRILKKKSGFEFWNWLPDSFCYRWSRKLIKH